MSALKLISLQNNSIGNQQVENFMNLVVMTAPGIKNNFEMIL
jgi:hypothetical protein